MSEEDVDGFLDDHESRSLCHVFPLRNEARTESRLSCAFAGETGGPPAGSRRRLSALLPSTMAPDDVSPGYQQEVDVLPRFVGTQGRLVRSAHVDPSRSELDKLT